MKTINSVLLFFLSMIIAIIVFSSCTPAQPKSDYRLSWVAEPNSAKYYVFFEQGTSSNPANYQLQQGMDWKNGTVGFFVDSVNAPTTSYVMTNIDNNGQYIVFGVVGVSADGLYGPMGVSAPFKKPTVPSAPITLPIIRLTP